MDYLLTYFHQHYGSRTKLATWLEITPSAITQWKAIPAEHVRKVADFTGIAPALLRPDLFEGMESAA